MTRDTDTHPVDTTYDVLVPGHAARVRERPLAEALTALRTMRSETPECILVAHLPSGERVVGCFGSWENLDGSVTL
jgi:hypothetical protein